VAAAVALALVSCSPNPDKKAAQYLLSGQKYAKAGKYQEAVIQFRNAIDMRPRLAGPHYQLALAYLSLKSPQQAYQELVSTVELDPRNIDAQLELASLLLGARKYGELQTTLETVIAADAENARAHTLLGEKNASEHVWDAAVREYQLAMSLDPHASENYRGLAMVYASTGKLSEAEAMLRKGIEVQPKSVQAFIALGRFYYAQHRLADAEAVMRVASDADAHAKEPRILLAKIYMDSGRTAEAELACRALKSSVPDDPEALGALASFYETTGQKEKEVAELEELATAHPQEFIIKARLTDALIDLDHIPEAARLNQTLYSAVPLDPRVLSSRGRILIAEEKYAAAKTALEQAVQSDPESATAHYLIGVTESALDEFANARTSFTRALELSPGMAEAAVALADLEASSGDWDDALRLAKQGLQARPSSSLAHVIVAKAMLAKGNASQAEVELHSALEYDPVFLRAIAALLDLKISQGRTKEAIQTISALASQHPENARIRLLLGQAYLKQGDLASAETSVKRAVAIDRNAPDAYGVLGEISRARGEWDQAISWYKIASEANPKKVENFMALSGLYDRQGNTPEAIRSAERAHSLDPASPFIANNLAYLYLEHGGDIHMALFLAQQAKLKLPDSPIVSDTIGWAYYKLGSPDNAVAALSESVRKAPDNATYRYHLGMAFLAIGKPGNAAHSLQDALAANPSFPDAESARTTLRTISKNTR